MPRDPYVVHPLDPTSHDLGGHSRLRRHGQVRRSRACHDNAGRRLSPHLAVDRNRPRHFIEDCVGSDLANRPVSLYGGLRYQQQVEALQQSLGQPPNLLRRLTHSEDDLRETLTNRTVVVDLGKPNILEGRR